MATWNYVTKEDFYNAFLAKLALEVNSLNEMDEIIADLEKGINSGKFSAGTMSEMRTDANHLRWRKKEKIEQGGIKMRSFCERFIAEMKKNDKLDGGQINEGDLKLLQAGIPLYEQDIKAMLDRNAENATMVQLILRYADEHSIKTGLQYNSPANSIAPWVEAAADAARVVIKNAESPYVYSQFFSEGASINDFFMDGDGTNFEMSYNIYE